VRSLAVFLPDEKAVETLRKAAEDPDPAVKSAATEALHSPLIKAVGEMARESKLVAAVSEVKDEKLQGSLREIPIDQVCQLIANSNKSGALLLNYGGPVAKVFFENGFVVHVDYEGREGQEAVNLFFRLRGGTFLFQPGEVAPKRPIRLSVQQLLLEASRRLDERAKGKM
jgi:hypothetical protein